VNYKRYQLLLFSLLRLLLLFLLTFFLVCQQTENYQIEAAEKTANPSALTLLDAVQLTLTQQPNIRIASQKVNRKKAQIQSADGRFDLLINSSMSYHETFMPLSQAQESITGSTSRDEGITDFTLSFNQELSNGIILQPSLSLTRTDDKSFGGQTQNDASVNFNLIIPLQKGWGRDVAGAEIRSAQVSLQSSEFNLQHTTAVSVKDVAAAYWNFVAAEKKLAILKKIETSTKNAVADMQALIKADASPASNLKPLMAQLFDKSLSRVAAEQNLLSARHQLGLAMGLTRIGNGDLSHPLDSFPKPIALVSTTDRSLIAKLKSIALQNRTDLKALARKEAALQIDLIAVQNDLKSQIDLVFSSGYNGLAEGSSWRKSINSFSSQVPGLNYGVALNYQFPYQNNQARGQLGQLEADIAQARITTADLERNINSQVEVVFEALFRSLEQLQFSTGAVETYQRVVADEKEKVRLGISTVVDLIAMADKLENALLAEVSTQQNYANALLALRFTTGTLIKWQGDESSLSLKRFTSMPDI
jgi:outer membrane protein TolC